MRLKSSERCHFLMLAGGISVTDVSHEGKLVMPQKHAAQLAYRYASGADPGF